MRVYFVLVFSAIWLCKTKICLIKSLIKFCRFLKFVLIIIKNCVKSTNKKIKNRSILFLVSVLCICALYNRFKFWVDELFLFLISFLHKFVLLSFYGLVANHRDKFLLCLLYLSLSLRSAIKLKTPEFLCLDFEQFYVWKASVKEKQTHWLPGVYTTRIKLNKKTLPINFNFQGVFIHTFSFLVF